jgi:hypothetical protein
MAPDGKINIFLYCTFLSKCLDCLMIFNIELPFSSNKTRIWPDPNPTDPDPDPGGQKTTDPAPYILSLLIFYTTFCQIEVFAKTFREKLTKFRENCDTFRKSFCFRKRSKKCFRPNPSGGYPNVRIHFALCTSVAKGPKFRSQSTKGALYNCVGPGKSAAVKADTFLKLNFAQLYFRQKIEISHW